ncbi:hypothetical protein [Neptuniibacter sp. QD37_11]|uniref:hypothetical protein n=1 Tax=Neptuniibacter sp. QD37_11 TaxID=3398209 RepID=UPI0039F52E80
MNIRIHDIKTCEISTNAAVMDKLHKQFGDSCCMKAQNDRMVIFDMDDVGDLGVGQDLLSILLEEDPQSTTIPKLLEQAASCHEIRITC